MITNVCLVVNYMVITTAPGSRLKNLLAADCH